MTPRADREGIIGLAQALVRIPSTNDPDRGRSEAAAAELVAGWMRKRGWQPVLEEVAPGRPNVICTIDGGLPGPTLCLEGHTDVVTEGDASAWERDPFGAEIVDGVLWGRGSADMKGGVAAMLYAAAALAEDGPFPGRLVLAVLVDEEGMMLGAKDFVRAGHASDIDAAIICEPEAGEVCLSQKGAIRVRASAHGRMAHGAMPDHGVNPLPALAAFVVAIRDFQSELQARFGAHEHLGPPYVTPTVLRAGHPDQVNVIPAAGTVALDIRTIPGMDHRELIDRLRQIAGSVSRDAACRLELEVVDDRPPTELAPAAPIARAVADAHRTVTGVEPVLGGVPGTTDGTILWRDAGIPVVVYGPGGKWIAHQVNEHCAVDEMVTASLVYVEAARRFLGSGTHG